MVYPLESVFPGGWGPIIRGATPPLAGEWLGDVSIRGVAAVQSLRLYLIGKRGCKDEESCDDNLGYED